MLTQVVIQNFKCLRDVTLRLSPLTVLVGANGTGKSAVLDALDPALRYHSETVWQRDRTREVLVTRTREDGATCTSRYLGDRARDAFLVEGERYVCGGIRLDPAALRRSDPAEERRRLAPDGGNLSSVITSLTRPELKRLAEQLCALVPLYRDVAVRSIKGKSGQHGLCFRDRWHEDLWYRPAEVSDGTLLLLALLALGFQHEPPDLLTIEEPERDLHPYLIGPVMALLHDLTTGAIGPRPVQVVVATHSAMLLNHLQPEEVRFLRRAPEDGSVILEGAPTRQRGWAKKLAEYQDSLSRAWVAGPLGGANGKG
jgi:predicted ATPase